ncbi:MAG: hypothetical protein AB7F31_01475 [Parachlamydiales bacterium]
MATTADTLKPTKIEMPNLIESDFVKQVTPGLSSYAKTGLGHLEKEMGLEYEEAHVLLNSTGGLLQREDSTWAKTIKRYTHQVYKPWIADWQTVGERGERVTWRTTHFKKLVKAAFKERRWPSSFELSNMAKGGADKAFYWGLVYLEQQKDHLTGLSRPKQGPSIPVKLESTPLFKQAADLSYLEAMCEYGYCCETGWYDQVTVESNGDVILNKPDLALAKNWYKKAAEGDSPVGYYLLARLALLKSHGVFSEEVVGLLKNATENSQKTSQKRIPGAFYLLGEYYESVGNKEEAVKYYELAISQDVYPPAAYRLANYYLTANNYCKAIENYEKATHPLQFMQEQEEPGDGYFPDERACYEYALILKDGKYGVRPDPAKALQCLLLGQRFGRPHKESLEELSHWFSGERWPRLKNEKLAEYFRQLVARFPEGGSSANQEIPSSVNPPPAETQPIVASALENTDQLAEPSPPTLDDSASAEETLEELQVGIGETEDKLTKLDLEIHNLKNRLEQVERGQGTLQKLEKEVEYHRELLSHKIKKKEAIEQFQDNPNLLTFYYRFQRRLNSIFISAHALQGGSVGASKGKLGHAGNTLNLFAGAFGMIPVFGGAAEKVAEVIGAAFQFLDKKRVTNQAANIADIGPVPYVDKEIEEAARELTKIFKPQLKKIATSEEVLELRKKNRLTRFGSFSEGIREGKDMVGEWILCSTSQAPAADVADFAALWVCEHLNNLEHEKSAPTLAGFSSRLVNIVMQKRPRAASSGKSWSDLKAKFKEGKESFSTLVGLSVVLTKNGGSWPLEGLFTRCGIHDRHRNEYYGSPANGCDTTKYGWCLGTLEHAKMRGIANLSTSTQRAIKDHTDEIKKLKHDVSRIDNWQNVQEWHNKITRVEEENQQLKLLLNSLAQHLNKTNSLPPELMNQFSSATVGVAARPVQATNSQTASPLSGNNSTCGSEKESKQEKTN